MGEKSLFFFRFQEQIRTNHQVRFGGPAIHLQDVILASLFLAPKNGTPIPHTGAEVVRGVDPEIFTEHKRSSGLQGRLLGSAWGLQGVVRGGGRPVWGALLLHKYAFRFSRGEKAWVLLRQQCVLRPSCESLDSELVQEADKEGRASSSSGFKGS